MRGKGRRMPSLLVVCAALATFAHCSVHDITEVANLGSVLDLEDSLVQLVDETPKDITQLQAQEAKDKMHAEDEVQAMVKMGAEERMLAAHAMNVQAKKNAQNETKYALRLEANLDAYTAEENDRMKKMQLTEHQEAMKEAAKLVAGKIQQATIKKIVAKLSEKAVESADKEMVKSQNAAAAKAGNMADKKVESTIAKSIAQTVSKIPPASAPGPAAVQPTDGAKNIADQEAAKTANNGQAPAAVNQAAATNQAAAGAAKNGQAPADRIRLGAPAVSAVVATPKVLLPQGNPEQTSSIINSVMKAEEKKLVGTGTGSASPLRQSLISKEYLKQKRKLEDTQLEPGRLSSLAEVAARQKINDQEEALKAELRSKMVHKLDLSEAVIKQKIDKQMVKTKTIRGTPEGQDLEYMFQHRAEYMRTDSKLTEQADAALKTALQDTVLPELAKAMLPRIKQEETERVDKEAKGMAATIVDKKIREEAEEKAKVQAALAKSADEMKKVQSAMNPKNTEADITPIQKQIIDIVNANSDAKNKKVKADLKKAWDNFLAAKLAANGGDAQASAREAAAGLQVDKLIGVAAESLPPASGVKALMSKIQAARSAPAAQEALQKEVKNTVAGGSTGSAGGSGKHMWKAADLFMHN